MSEKVKYNPAEATKGLAHGAELAGILAIAIIGTIIGFLSGAVRRN